MKLIDFDCIGFSDNALEIVEIFQAFAFTKIQTELFLKTYNKITKDKSLQDRIDMFKPLKALFWYLWALEGIYFENRKDNFYQDEKMRAIQMINKIE